MRSFGFLRQRSDTIKLSAGTLVYKEGPRAGQLYMISEGEVEVFKENAEGSETLATFGPGEIVGLMNVIAGGEHNTSARVTKDVVAMSIPREQIRRCFASEPPWLESIFNAFVRRVRELTTALNTLNNLNRNLRQSQITKLYTATQVAAVLSTFGESMSIQVDDKKMLVRDEVIDLIASTLVRTRTDIERVIDVFCEAGLIKLSIDPDHRRKLIELAYAKRLSSFVQFVSAARSGRLRKLVRTPLHTREKRLLVALVRFAKSLPGGTPAMARLPIAEVVQRIKPVTGYELDLELVPRVEQLGFIRTEGSGDTLKLIFSPAELGLTMACLEAYRKLAKVESDDQQMTEKVLQSALL